MSILSSILHTSNDVDNIPKALTMFEGVSKRDPSLASQYLDPAQFVNHNLQAPEGVAGIQGFISHLPPAGAPLKVARAFQDGDYVFTHAEGDIFGPKVFFDIFKFEDGKIVEHWDNLTAATPPNQSGHTATDGPTEAEDLDRTEENKALVKDFYETIFLRADFQKLGQFFQGDKYIRHDARGGDNLSSLQALMQEQAKQGVTMKVDKIALILGQVNFVLVAAGGSISDKPVAYYDLFRVEENKIAEHWDVIEEIPPREQWRNQSGKF